MNESTPISNEEPKKIDYEKIAKILAPAFSEVFKEVAAYTSNKWDDKVAEIVDDVVDTICKPKE